MLERSIKSIKTVEVTTSSTDIVACDSDSQSDSESDEYNLLDFWND